MSARSSARSGHRPVRTYAVTVERYGEAMYAARSPGKAFGRAYRDMLTARDDLKFADFMKMARLRRVKDPPGCGERIVVQGRTVTRCYGPASPAIGIYFMPDDSDEVLVAHPLDVEDQGKSAGGVGAK